MALDEKLFLLDDTFGKILLQHRKNCQEMEQLRVVNLRWNNSEIGNLQAMVFAKPMPDFLAP